MNAATDPFVEIVDNQANEAILFHSPCLKYKISIVLYFTKSNKEPLESSTTEYNKPLGPDSTYTGPDLY